MIDILSLLAWRLAVFYEISVNVASDLPGHMEIQHTRVAVLSVRSLFLKEIPGTFCADVHRQAVRLYSHGTWNANRKPLIQCGMIVRSRGASPSSLHGMA